MPTKEETPVLNTAKAGLTNTGGEIDTFNEDHSVMYEVSLECNASALKMKE